MRRARMSRDAQLTPPGLRWIATAGSLLLLLSLVAAPLGAGHPGTSMAPKVSANSPGGIAPRVLPIKSAERVAISPRGQGPASHFLPQYSKEPAPMGIADYGVANLTTGAGAYSYRTSAVRGLVTLGDNPIVSNPSLGGSRAVTFETQLNVMLTFSLPGGATYVYWVQNCVYYNTTSDHLYQFVDNIWNMSASGSQMYSSSVSGSGSVKQSSAGGFYVDAVGATPGGGSVPMVQGDSYTVEMDTGVSAGVPFVKFIYNDSSSGSFTYDTASFTFATDANSSSFFINHSSTPVGIPYDLELVFCGPGSGSQQYDVRSDLYYQLYYFNGANFQAPRSAYNWGSETAEGMHNVSDTLSSSSPAGGLSAVLVNGNLQNSVLAQLYSPAQVSALNFTDSSASGGTLTVNGASTPFSGTWANLTLGPGSYSVSVQVAGTTTTIGQCTLVAGSVMQINLTSTCAAIPTPTPTPTTSSSIEIGITVAALLAGVLVTLFVLGGFRRRALPGPAATAPGVPSGPAVSPPGWGPPTSGYPGVAGGYPPGYGLPAPEEGPPPVSQGPPLGAPPPTPPPTPPPAYGTLPPAAPPPSGPPTTTPPPSRTCTRCGYLAGPGAVWCSRCGSPLPPG